MSESLAATPRESLAEVCLRPAKAELREQVGATPLRDVAAEAMRRTSSQKAAALDLGINEGRLSHKLKDGSLTVAQLEALGPHYAAELGRALVEQYREAQESAQDRARRVIPALIKELLDVVA